MGGSSGGGGVIPFNIGALAPFMPSVFNGPYNAEGAYQNEQMLSQKYPWITPPSGQFEGAQPGQYAGAGTGGGVSGFTPPPPPSPPVPPTAPSPPTSAQFNPAAMTTGQTNAMNPNSLQAILAVLGAQNPTAAAPAGGGQ